ncbi:MAG: PAS domain S-box protein, partial [Caldithrix sp.]|nr:PAS domain S-box protein [Caldithrix sp.]
MDYKHPEFEERLEHRKAESKRNQKLADMAEQASKYKVEYEKLQKYLRNMEQELHNLKEKQQFFGSIFKALPVGIVITDKEGIIRFCNERIVEISGLSEAELSGAQLT